MRIFPHCLLSVCSILCITVSAQTTIYKIEKPGGAITFADRQPTLPEDGRVVATGVGAQSVLASANLPFELKQAVGKFPVTLYTAAECSPCESARSLLTSRGIPFNERTVSTAEDSEQLKKISGETALPFLTIGGQRIKGFSPTDWAQYLDAAGYPASSMLPKGYKNPPATPLVPPPVAANNKAAPKETPPPKPANNNPDGFVF
jgi:glutaredoxin